MLLLRCTNKVLKELNMSKSSFPDVMENEHPLLEWYVNLFYFNRKKCLLFTNAASLFSFVAHDVKRKEIINLDKLFREELAKAMSYEDFNSEQIKFVNEQIGEIILLKTASHSILASMNDLVRHCIYSKIRLAEDDNMEDVGEIQRDLNEIPMGALKYQFSIECFMDLVGGEKIDFIERRKKYAPKNIITHIFNIQMIQYCEGKNITRQIAISGNKSLEHFAKVILSFFDFNCDHCFAFYGDIDKHPGPEQTEIYEAFVDIEGIEPTNDLAMSVKKTKIETAFKEVGKKMMFMFDYGDDWRFLIELKEMRDKQLGEYLPRLLKSVGEAPPQYR